MGVTGGEPVGFDVGAKGAGGTLPGLDLVSHQSALCHHVHCTHPGTASAADNHLSKMRSYWLS